MVDFSPQIKKWQGEAGDDTRLRSAIRWDGDVQECTDLIWHDSNVHVIHIYVEMWFYFHVVLEYELY